MNGTNGSTPLEPNDELLLRQLAGAGCNLRVSELVNDNRYHDMDAAEVEARLERLRSLGYVRVANWVATPAGHEAMVPRFAPLDALAKP